MPEGVSQVRVTVPCEPTNADTFVVLLGRELPEPTGSSASSSAVCSLEVSTGLDTVSEDATAAMVVGAEEDATSTVDSPSAKMRLQNWVIRKSPSWLKITKPSILGYRAWT